MVTRLFLPRTTISPLAASLFASRIPSYSNITMMSRSLRLLSTRNFRPSPVPCCALRRTTNHQHRSFVSATPAVSSSSASSSFSMNPVDWWRGRQERNEANKYKERLQAMAQKKDWTIGDMQAELQEVEKSWLAKIQDSAEVRQAKQMNATVKGIVGVVGVDAVDEDLLHMTRAQKLQASIMSGGRANVEQINMLIQQFQTMGLMHRVLRQRQAQGKSIPTTAEAMQSIMQVEGPKLMSPAHKKSMIQLQQKRMKRALVKRR